MPILPLLVVEPIESQPDRWRFGRVAEENAQLTGTDIGEFEVRDGQFVMVRNHADAITALLLLRRHEGASRRLVHRLEGLSAPLPERRGDAALPSTVVVRSTADRAKGGSGESLGERAERLRKAAAQA